MSMGDDMMDQLFKVLECPNGGVGNVCTTPRAKRSANRISDGEVNIELIFLSYDNVKSER